MPTARIVARTGIAALAVLALAACGGSAATSAPAAPTAAATTAAATSPAAGGDAVSIVDLAFEPASLTVSTGTTVTWTNNGQQPHTVKWSDGEPESDQLENGDTYERTFDTAGTFDYVCGIHPAMTGSITVE